MIRKVLVALSLSFMASASDATLVTIDFEDSSHGVTLPTDAYASRGIGISLIGLGNTGPNMWAINANSGGSEGNAIWPSTATVAVDDGPFDDMDLRFTIPIDFFSIIALDVDAGETYRFVTYLGDTLVGVGESRVQTGTYRMTNPYTGSSIGGPIFENVLGQIGGAVSFDRVVVDLDAGGPELWDTIRFNTVAVVPTPAAVWLLGSTLGLLGWMRRKAAA